MTTSPYIFRWLAALVLLLPVLTSSAADGGRVPDPRLVGQWQGHDQFYGMSYDEIAKHQVTVQPVITELVIAADGRVTGHVGGAELRDGMVSANRGWLGRFLHLYTDFIIRGKLVGAVIPGSAGGSHEISAPFNLDGSRIRGSLFVLRGSFSYPYPILQLQLGR